MKAYQGLHEGEVIFITAPAGWRMVKAKGLPGFYELLDSKGKHAILLREFDIQELPAMQPSLARAAGQGGVE